MQATAEITNNMLYDLLKDFKEDFRTFKIEVNQKFASNTQRIEKLEEDVSVLKSDVAVLKSDVTVLKSDVSEIKTSIHRLEKDMHEIKKGNTPYSKYLLLSVGIITVALSICTTIITILLTT